MPEPRAVTLSPMSDLSSTEPTPRGQRRRADAHRSIIAILDASGQVLGRDPAASMDEIARAAGLSRQTVYAHFPTREALIAAIVERSAERALSAMADADLDALAPGDAICRLLATLWEIFESEPVLIALPGAMASASAEQERHEPILIQLERIIRRGRRTGEFDRTAPIAWQTAATVALGHAASEEIRTGRMTPKQGVGTAQRAVLRLLSPDPTPSQVLQP